MKKLGILIFIVAILVGVVFANLFSFGRATGNIFSFSFGSSIKGSGVAETEARQVSDFSAVDVGGVFQVEITSGKDFSVEVSADNNLLPYIKTEVRGDVLHIESTQRLKSQSPMKVVISAPNIERLEASGASKVSLGAVKNSTLDINTSGASKVAVDGETSLVNIEVSGASRIDAESLKAKTAEIDASGASNVSVFVTDRLVSDASGASRISYSGNPTSIEKKSSGASSIHQK